MVSVFIDADACPVKEEVYKVARRYAVPVSVVANAWINIPREPLLETLPGDRAPGLSRI